ncbi:MAG: trypsin-like peptidase domain-containing protein [Acholeplasmatales bacterium]|nr:trypsin-like peptidase domain-containing protein [Acholeplasmatales bacterium]
MKKHLFLGLGLILSTILFLASCSVNSIIRDNENTVNTNTTTESTTYESNYESPSCDIKTTTSTSGNSIEDTVEMVYESVVSIEASSYTSISRGSGVLFQSDETLGLSYIVTCYHVVEGQTSFSVTIPKYSTDGTNESTTYEAKYVGGTENNDLAVLSIEGTDYTYASIFDDSDKLRLGSTAIVIGNPLGTLPGSVSAGVVSYVNRVINKDSYEKLKLIQTDASINSGNSGGGLFNSAGALIGIVNAKYSSNYTSSSSIEGLGFAIPSNQVKSVITSVLATASYDTINKVWDTGYVEGDFEFGFTLSQQNSITQGGYISRLFVSAVSSNEYYSGTNLKTMTVVSEIKVNYKNNRKEAISFKSPNNTLNTSLATEATKFLYDAELEIGDTVTFVYADSSEVSFNIIQFK